MPISTAVDVSAVARVVGIKTAFQNLRGGNIVYLPQRVAVVGQGSSAATYSANKRQCFTANEVGTVYGFGSQLHLAALQLLPANGDGIGSIPMTIYPMVDAVSSTAATFTITVTGTGTGPGTYQVSIGNILSQAFNVALSDTPTAVAAKIVTAINAILGIPVVATNSAGVVTCTTKWKGASGTFVSAIVGTDAAGITFSISATTAGTVNPDVSTALAQFGNVWESMVLNCMNITDTATLDLIAGANEGRWGALVRKPFVCFTGSATTTVPPSVGAARGSDRSNAGLHSPGSADPHFVIAARILARIVVVANNTPASDYGGQRATGLTPGADGVQWLYNQRDTAVKNGASTVEVIDGVVTLADTVTFYHPNGDPTPAYRYVCDIVKLQNIIFNLDLIFATPEWNGAPLIPDDQPTANRQAKKPKAAKAAVAAMVDSLGLDAILSNPELAKASIQAQISDQNPKRLDLAVTVQLSGNTNIISVDLNFGFYFGVVTPVA